MKISTVVAFPAASSLSPPSSLCFCSSSRSYHSIPYSSFPFVFFSLSLSLSNQKGVLKRVEPSSSPPTLQSLFDLVYEMTTAIAIEDVRREVKILKALSRHKNLVRFYDAFEDANNVYIVMELCKGGELLDKILSRGGRYTEEDAKVIVVKILSVIAYCHLQDVVHCDLKPENFLFATREEDASVRVIDFGLSDFIRPSNASTYYFSWLQECVTAL
ncbi:CDPK-related kinase 7-like [Rosa chinensis]|uniref:CDPK-related kinase 7-like n=1 Tax=Rosa chinensis TaxID=74649 RepID=UPI000D08D0BC|nr:CDPK-related kinase 7-like [Rosa chinensis]